MSGPTATVLLPAPLSGPDRAVLRGLIDAISDHDLDSPPSLDAFWVSDTRLIGGRHTVDSRPFAMETGLQADEWPERLGLVADAFGFMAQGELTVIAFCNADGDHRILGEMCLRLAERFGGVIDFGGGLLPRVPPEWGIDLLRADWREVEPHFRRMVAGMPGRVVGLRHCPQPGSEWVSHVGDAEFLRAWLEHPWFRMVK